MSPTTTARRRVRAPEAPGWARTAALVAVVVLLVDTATPVLPDAPLVGWLTIGRLLVLAGLATLGLGGARPSDLRTPADLPLLTMVGAAVLATWRIGGGFAQVRELVFAVLSFVLVVGVLRTTEGARTAVPVAGLAAAAFAGAEGLSQMAQGEETPFRRIGVVRAVGTFGNPNLLAAHGLLLAPLAWPLAQGRAGRAERVLIGTALALGVGGVAVSVSRAGIAALVAAPLLVVLLRRTTSWRVWGPALAVVALGLLSVPLWLGAFSRLANRDEPFAVAFEVVRANPVTGVGYGRAGVVLTATGGGTEWFHAHNLWLNWLVETGPLGLLAVLGLTAAVVLGAVVAVRDGSALALGAGVGLVAFLLVSLVDHPAANSRIETAFLLVAGIALTDAPPWPRVLGRRAGRHPGPRRRRRPAPVADDGPRLTR